MILTLVAELIAGETLLADGGPVDGATAAADDVELWGLWHLAGAQSGLDAETVAAVEEPVA